MPGLFGVLLRTFEDFPRTGDSAGASRTSADGTGAPSASRPHRPVGHTGRSAEGAGRGGLGARPRGKWAATACGSSMSSP
ncbi:hypothetical protein SGRIM128S_05161 [Streptomyces griseomycini]